MRTLKEDALIESFEKTFLAIATDLLTGPRASALNIMQDQITRSRLAGEPPHIMLTPQLSDLGILEFNRAEEAIVEGSNSVRRSLPILREFIPCSR